MCGLVRAYLDQISRVLEVSDRNYSLQAPSIQRTLPRIWLGLPAHSVRAGSLERHRPPPKGFPSWCKLRSLLGVGREGGSTRSASASGPWSERAEHSERLFVLRAPGPAHTPDGPGAQ